MTAPRPGQPEHRPDPRPIWFVLSFYPRWWRQRYGEEFAALLADLTESASRPVRARLLINALRGGLIARLAPTAERMMPDRSKEPLATIACAIMVFAVGVAGLAKLREGAVFSSVAHAHTAVDTSLDVLQGAAALAGVAVLAGLVPLAWMVLRQVIVDRRPGLIGPLVTGLLAPLGWFGLVWITAQLIGANPAGPNLAVILVVALSGAAAVVICAGAVMTLIRRAQLPGRLLRAEVPAMAVLSLSMAVASAADIAWGLSIRSADAALFNSDNGLVSTPFAPNWAGSAMILSAVTVVVFAATARAARRPARVPM
ncbi:MAG TPA: hypothetical protein VHW06_22550 [Streptosporangiaceae bacterium]|nr:hypothetical protein [Streptosporangiaceae bacterium]